MEFIVERSVDGQLFDSLLSIRVKSQNGLMNEYSFLDEFPLKFDI